MSLKKISKTQPELFEFTNENLQKANKEIKKYPNKRKASAVLALLYLVQNQNDNWIPLAALKFIGNFLSMPYINVYEIQITDLIHLAPIYLEIGQRIKYNLH